MVAITYKPPKNHVTLKFYNLKIKQLYINLNQ